MDESGLTQQINLSEKPAAHRNIAAGFFIHKNKLWEINAINP